MKTEDRREKRLKRFTIRIKSFTIRFQFSDYSTDMKPEKTFKLLGINFERYSL